MCKSERGGVMPLNKHSYAYMDFQSINENHCIIKRKGALTAHGRVMP